MRFPQSILYDTNQSPSLLRRHSLLTLPAVFVRIQVLLQLVYGGLIQIQEDLHASIRVLTTTFVVVLCLDVERVTGVFLQPSQDGLMAIQAVLHLVFHLALKHTQLLLYYVYQLFHASAGNAAYSRRSIVTLSLRSQIDLVPYLQHALVVKR